MMGTLGLKNGDVKSFSLGLFSEFRCQIKVAVDSKRINLHNCGI